MGFYLEYLIGKNEKMLIDKI
jgi:hypothetical protein